MKRSRCLVPWILSLAVTTAGCSERKEVVTPCCPPPSVVVSRQTLILTVGMADSVFALASFVPASGDQSIAWQLGDTSIARIASASNRAAIVVGVAPGSTTLTARLVAYPAY